MKQIGEAISWLHTQGVCHRECAQRTHPPEKGGRSLPHRVAAIAIWRLPSRARHTHTHRTPTRKPPARVRVRAFVRCAVCGWVCVCVGGGGEGQGDGGRTRSAPPAVASQPQAREPAAGDDRQGRPD
eukprot:1262741-Prymnesium_polylepis.1